jgi:hypothetical protein
LQDYVTGKSLSALDAKLRVEAKMKKQAEKTAAKKNNARLKKMLEKNGKALLTKRKHPMAQKIEKARILETPDTTVAIRIQSEIPPRGENGVTAMETAQAQPMTMKTTTSIDSWQNQLTNQLNAIGIGKSSSQLKKMDSLLSPVLLIENGGLIYSTSLLGVKNKNGTISIPKELSIQALTSPNILPQIQNRTQITEVPEENELLQNESDMLEPAPSETLNQMPIFQNQGKDGRQANPPLRENVESIQENMDQEPELDLPSQRPRTSQVPNSNHRFGISEELQFERLKRLNDDESRQTSQTTLPRQKRSTSQTSGADVIDAFYNPARPTMYAPLHVKNFNIKNDIVSIHKPYSRKFPRNPIITPGLYSHLFADLLVAYINDASTNSNYQYILVVVDGLSKKLFARPLYTKEPQEVSEQLEELLRHLDLPGTSFFLSDRGNEFGFLIWPTLDKFNMTPIQLRGQHKAAPCERVM